MDITKPTEKDKEKDQQYLSACLMGLHAILGIGERMAQEAFSIVKKYIKDPNNEMRKEFTALQTNFSNKAASLGKLGKNNPTNERKTATTLSAANFLNLYFAAMKISPDQLDDFCGEIDVIANSYASQRAQSFDFWQWLVEKQGFEKDVNGYYKGEFVVRTLMQNCTIQKGVNIVFNAPPPKSEFTAMQLFELIECPLVIINDIDNAKRLDTQKEKR